MASKNIRKLILIIFTLSNFVANGRDNRIGSFSRYAEEKMNIIINPPPINPPGNPNDPPIVPNDPFLPYLNDKRPYKLENAEIVGERILAAAREYDINATHLSYVDGFDQNNQNCVTIDANNFIEIMEDDSYFSIFDKANAMREAWISDSPMEIIPDEMDFCDLDFPNPNNDVNLNIFVHGIGGAAYHWSNDGTRNFKLNSSSLLYKLSEIYFSNIYVLDATDNKIYLSVNGTLEYTGKLLTSNNISFSNNDIIVYEDVDNSILSNQTFYRRFNQKMSYIHNRFMENGKFNFFGHSRGGLINLMFATAHPTWIRNMYSLGTPYFSPALASFESVLNSLPDNSSLSPLKNFVESIDSHCEAYEDLANIELMDGYRRSWNSIDHSNIHFKTYGFDTAGVYSTYIIIGILIIQIVHYVVLGFDGLVGSGNATGLSYNMVTHLSTGFLNYVLPVFNRSDTNEDLEVDDYRVFNIAGIYLFGLQIFNSNKYLLSDPYNLAVTHNAETMYWEVVDDIIQDLQNH